MTALKELLHDLAPFADLGTDAPSGIMDGGNAVIGLWRNGDFCTVRVEESGVVEQIGASSTRHSSFKALLASPRYADLARWADQQRVSLSSIVDRETIPVTGAVSDKIEEGWLAVDGLLKTGQSLGKRNTVVVVDGPAGIGKSALVRKIAFERSSKYSTRRDPLVLHVESRGRVLQNLTDLMAFGLQSLRLLVTFDQVPILVKHGLIVLAIDGFDELGDPSGYDLAWAQLNELIEATRGAGGLVLSGRETFISGHRIRTALPALEEPLDELMTFTVYPVQPTVARRWLSRQGWPETAFEAENAAPLFAAGSYALRPFFLRQLADSETATEILSGVIDDTLSFLIWTMLTREQKKFGKDIEAATTAYEREKFVVDLMEEVARDMAENQSDAISSDTISWLSDAVSDALPAGVQGILRNRAGVVAFLTNDERRGYRKFVHEEVYNFFLSRVIIKAISGGETPKFVRRNILSLDILESFSDVVRNSSASQIAEFLEQCVALLRVLPDQDRSRGNIASLLMAALSVTSAEEVISIADVAIDEARLSETVSALRLQRVSVNQLDVRDADLRLVEFVDCNVVTLVGSDSTIPSTSIPAPKVLATERETFTNPQQMEAWFAKQHWKVAGFPEFSLQEMLARMPMMQLLSRVARYKPFWIKDGDDKSARKILDDPQWDQLRAMLEKHGYLLVRNDVPASGKNAMFYHLRSRESFLNIDSSHTDLLPLLREIVAVSDEMHKVEE